MMHGQKYIKLNSAVMLVNIILKYSLNIIWNTVNIVQVTGYLSWKEQQFMVVRFMSILRKTDCK